MEKNCLVEYTPPAKKKRPVLRAMAIILCAVALVFGSSYISTRIALNNVEAFGFSIETVQAYNPPPTITNGAIPDSTFLTANTITNQNELTLPDLFDGANPAVVAISTEVTGRNAFGQTVTRPASGSGFFISSDGYIVTNDHVIENVRNITVLLYNGRQYPATVVGRDPASDIAVIKINVTGIAYLTFGNSDAVRVGEQVAAIGNPLGELANSMTVGWISALDRDITVDGVTRTKLQTDAAVNRGNSGGPLLNLHGEVIGVVNAKSVGVDVEGLGFALPSNDVRAVAEQLMEYGFIRGRAILGISVNEIIQWGTNRRMVQVSAVSIGGAADRAGIRVGDIILSVDGTAVSTFDGLRAVLDRRSPNDEVDVRINRGGTESTVRVTLDEYRPAGL